MLESNPRYSFSITEDVISKSVSVNTRLLQASKISEIGLISTSTSDLTIEKNWTFLKLSRESSLHEPSYWQAKVYFIKSTSSKIYIFALVENIQNDQLWCAEALCADTNRVKPLCVGTNELCEVTLESIKKGGKTWTWALSDAQTFVWKLLQTKGNVFEPILPRKRVTYRLTTKTTKPKDNNWP